MTLLQLRYVCEIVRQGFSVSRAAESLRLTQPGLSRQVLELERELGCELFVRQRNRLVALTDPGREVQRLAGRMLIDADAIRAVARDFTDEARGTLTIATTHTQARYALPDVLRRFSRRYPDVVLRLRQGTPADAARMVDDGTADLCIATAPVPPPPGLAFLPCYQLPRVILTPKGHPLNRERRVTLAMLARHPLITYDYGFVSTSRVLGTFARAGLTPNVVLNAIDADVIKTYVELGMGIAILPSLAFDRARDTALRQLPAGHLFEPNTIEIGVRGGDYLRGYTYAFIELFAPHLTRRTVDRARGGVGRASTIAAPPLRPSP